VNGRPQLEVAHVPRAHELEVVNLFGARQLMTDGGT